jgi:probable F420-dependent oxidoreductase
MRGSLEMRIDLVLPNEGDFMVEAMRSGPHYEAMGWDGLWLSDHLLGIVEDHLHEEQWLDVIVSMAHLAAQTRRIRIGSGVLVLPYRNPVLTARMVASLDHLSAGRIDLGVGVGWLGREYQALGVGDVFDQRGTYANEVLDVILTCWRGGTVQFKGRWFDIPPVVFEPPPLQPGGRVPLWVGSLTTTGAAIQRVAKYADYWHPSEADTEGRLLTPERFREAGERIDELAGREIPRTIRLRCSGDPSEKVDLLHRFAEVGCVQAACSFLTGSTTFTEFDRAATRFFELAAILRYT